MTLLLPALSVLCDWHCDCVKHPAAAVNIGDMLQKCYHHLLFLLFSMRHYAVNRCNELRFYRAMHLSAKRGIAIACRLSVRLSVTLVNCDHTGWNSSKIISPLVSLGCSLFAIPTWRVCSKGNTPKFGPKVAHPLLIWASETFDHKLRPNGYR